MLDLIAYATPLLKNLQNRPREARYELYQDDSGQWHHRQLKKNFNPKYFISPYGLFIDGQKVDLK